MRAGRWRRHLALIGVSALLALSGGWAAAQAGGARAAPRLWVARTNSPGNGQDFARDVQTSPDGTRVFITGYSRFAGAGNEDWTTVALDAVTGQRLWVATNNGPFDDSDRAFALAVSPDGTKVFVIGEARVNERTPDIATVAYDAFTGAQLWTAIHDGGGNDSGRSVAVAPNGSRVYITGASQDSFYTAAYDSASGTKIWDDQLHPPDARESEQPAEIVVSPDGPKVYVTGSRFSDVTQNDFATLAYGSGNGERLVEVRYDGGDAANDEGAAEALSPDGLTIYVTGESWSNATAYDYGLVAYDTTNGNERWRARYSGPGTNYDLPRAIQVSADGSRIIVTGQSENASGGYDYATVAFSSTGVQQWVSRYDATGGYDAAYDLGLSSDGGTVYVTGESDGVTTLRDYATVAYNAPTGAQLGVDRYDGSGHGLDSAYGLAVGPDGHIYVTGQSWAFGGSYDMITIAYSPS